MRNPYAKCRELAGLTQKQFCERYGFAKQTLIGIEQGMYPALSDRMVLSMMDALTEKGIYDAGLIDDWGHDSLPDAYEEWVEDERACVEPFSLDGTLKDVIDRATKGSVQGFAKLIKIPSATLLRYLNGGQEMMPSSIWTALKQCGFDVQEIAELEKRQGRVYAGL